jgi:hypothetical protein
MLSNIKSMPRTLTFRYFLAQTHTWSIAIAPLKQAQNINLTKKKATEEYHPDFYNNLIVWCYLINIMQQSAILEINLLVVSIGIISYSIAA